MNPANILICALLALGLLSFLLTALGILFILDFYEKIHFLAPGSLIGAVAIPAAVVVHEGLSQAGVKAILIAILLGFANPVLSHATARAGRIRRKGQWQPTPNEHIPVATDENAE